jgi:hypothetical protein
MLGWDKIKDISAEVGKLYLLIPNEDSIFWSS